MSLNGIIIDKKYRIDAEIGRGGMGIVFRAFHLDLGKDRALKRIDMMLANNAGFMKRFRNEARALAQLEDNNHIVQVYDILLDTPYGAFIVMEYVDGKTLSELIRSRALLWQDTLSIFKQTLEALSHAHSKGILHRDIKPSNIMLTASGVVKVMDFGLAKVNLPEDESGLQTKIGTRAGTLHYMPPEQIYDLTQVDHRSDLYSLGMTFYEVLTGHLPIKKRASESSIVRAISKEKFPALNRLNPSVPSELSRIVMKAIEKKPERRYQQADEMLAALEAFEAKYVPIEQADTLTDEETVSWSPSSSKRKWVLTASKRKWVLTTALVLVLLAGGISFGPQLLNLISPSSAGVEQPDPSSALGDISVDQPDEQNEPGSSGGEPDTLQRTLPTELTDTSDEEPDQQNVETQLASVKITTTPSGAQVRIDGARQDGPLASLKPGDHTITVEAAGYPRATREVKLSRGDNEELFFDLTQFMTLTLNADIDAVITLDGGPPGDSRLGEGRHRVVFRSKQTGATRDTTIVVPEGPKSTQDLMCYFLQEISVNAKDDTGDRIRFTLIIDENEGGEGLVVPETLEARPDDEPYLISAKKAGYTTEPPSRTLIVVPGFKEKEKEIIMFILKKNGTG